MNARDCFLERCSLLKANEPSFNQIDRSFFDGSNCDSNGAQSQEDLELFFSSLEENRSLESLFISDDWFPPRTSADFQSNKDRWLLVLGKLILRSPKLKVVELFKILQGRDVLWEGLVLSIARSSSIQEVVLSGYSSDRLNPTTRSIEPLLANTVSITELKETGRRSCSAKEWGYALAKNRSLTRLTTQVCGYDLLCSVAHHPTLKVYRTYTFEMPDVDYFAFRQLLEVNHCLEELKIEAFSIARIGPLARGLQRNKHLRKLNLQFSTNNRRDVVDEEDLRHFQIALEMNNSLEELEITEGRVIGKALARGLLQNEALRRLTVYHSSCFSALEDCELLAHVLLENRTLTSLELQDCQLGGRCAAKLAEGLRYNESLEQLNLSHNPIGNDGVVSISDAIFGNSKSSLRILQLEYCSIEGQRGGQAVGRMLRASAPLQELYLADDNFGEEGGILLSQGLRTNSSLKKLDLFVMNLGMRGAVAVLEAVRDNPSLHSLDIMVGASRDTGRALASMLLNNHSLMKLSLLTPGMVSDDHEVFVKDLVSGLAGNATLKELRFECSLSDSGIQNVGLFLASSSCTLDCCGLVLSASAEDSEDDDDSTESSPGASPERYGAFFECLPSMNGLKELSCNFDIPEEIVLEALKKNTYLQKIEYRKRENCRHITDLYLRMNQLGRRLLHTDNLPPALWANILAKTTAPKDSSCLFHFLQQRPSLMEAAAGSMQKRKGDEEGTHGGYGKRQCRDHEVAPAV